MPLPDQASVLTNHSIADLASECSSELRHVRDRSVDSPSCGGVRIAENLETLCFRSRLRRPDLSPAEEEALCRIEAIDLSRLFAAEIVHQLGVGDIQSAE